MKKTVLVIGIFALFAWASFEAVRSSMMTLDWTVLTRFSLVTFVLFTLVSLVNFAVFSLRWQRIVHAGRDKVVSFWNINMYRFVGYSVSYLTPFAQLGGEPVRIYFLEKDGIPRKEAVSSVLIDKLFEAGIQLIFVAITLAVVLTSGADLPSENLTVGMLVGLGALAITYLVMTIWGKGFFTQLFRWLHLHRIKKLASLEGKIERTEEVIRKFFRGHPRDLVWVCVLSLLTYGLFLLEYEVMLTSLGVMPTFRQLLVVSMLPMLAYLTPIPGAVGAFELLSIASMQIVGLDGSLALPIIAMIRLRDLLFLGVGFVYASSHGVKLAAKKG